jgi:hypothetical protein
MISWGTKYDYIGEFSNVQEEECKVCSAKIKSVYTCEQGVFTLYGLPLAPTSKKYFRNCPSCKAKLKAKRSDSNYALVTQQLQGGFKFKYVWGWIVLIPIIIGIIRFFMWVKSIK